MPPYFIQGMYMNWIGSGFVSIINYGSGGQAVEEQFVILTESGLNLLAEDGRDLLTENAVV